MAKRGPEYTRGRVHGYKHPRNGRWYVRFMQGGKREHYSLKVTRRETAEELVNELNDLLEAGQWSKVRNRTQAKDHAFKDAVTDFLAKGCRWSDSTRQGNQSTVAKLVEEFGEWPVGDVDAASIEAYLARRRDEGLSKGSRNRYLACLKAILGKAHEWGYTRSNAAGEIRAEREGRKQPRPFTQEEVGRLLAQLQPRHRRLAEVYLHTAMRRGELQKLMWSDVDFEVGTITVRSPKNDDDRAVPMSQRVVEILRERRREWEEERTTGVVDLLVFGRAADIRQVLNRAAGRARLEEGRRGRLQHRLRDTCATSLLDAGVPLDRVQAILGHRDIGMTRRYAETRPEHLKTAIATAFDRGA